MEQLILHLIGDYVTQSDWMAQNKTKHSYPAALHALVYTLPFLSLAQSAWAVFVICFTHFLIDRYRLARFVCFAKNWATHRQFSHFEYTWLGDSIPTRYEFCYDAVDYASMRPVHRHMSVAPPGAKKKYHPRLRWSDCSQTGYPSQSPPWLSVWLLIAADNTMHLGINFLALKYL